MRLTWRILLPVGHLVTDCVVLALWLWHANTLFQPRAAVSRQEIQPILLLQEGGTFDFELSSPDELIFLASGNLPAMLISDRLRPRAYIVTSSKRWDPSWFAIHEALCLLLWFTVGLLLDAGFLRIRKLMMMYLAARFGFAVFLLSHDVATIGWRLEVLAWMAFGVYAVVVTLRWIFSTIHARRLRVDS